MQRRPLLIASVAALAAAGGTPHGARAQARVPRIGYLNLRSGPIAQDAAFLAGLGELGYVDGQNIRIEYRWAAGKPERLDELVADLIRLEVDVIVTASVQAIQAAMRATKRIPIVMAAAADPVGSGLVMNLARPGGNVTGMSLLSTDLSGKRVALLHELLPDVKRVAAMKREQAQAVVVQINPLSNDRSRQIVELAATHRLPAMYDIRIFVDGGGLMSYGPGIADAYRRAASHVHRILRGAKPGELPVEQPTKFELVINLKTARALGLTIPQSLLLRADEVVE